MTKTIAAAAQALTQATQARDRIAAAVASLADADNTAAPAAELERLQRAHEATAAALALGETDAGTAKQTAQALAEAQRAVNEARADAAAAAATRAGLARRLADAEAAVIAAAAEMESTERQWLQSEAIAADAEYAANALAAWKAWTRVHAARSALVARGAPLDGMVSVQPPELRAIGPNSAQAVMRAHPSEPHGWAQTVTPRHEAIAGRMLIEAELAALREAPAGLVSRAAQALRKATS